MTSEPRGKVIDLRLLCSSELLTLYGDVLSVLRERKVVRSSNNPAADYAEMLTAKAFNLSLNSKSTAGCDACDKAGMRYEVKCRRRTRVTKSVQLSPFRNLDRKHFDYFVGIIFDADFKVARACCAPHRVVLEQAVHRTHVNGHILRLRDLFWSLPDVEDVTTKLQEAQVTLD